MPEGIDATGLYLSLMKLSGETKAREFWEWFTVTHRQWGAEGWSRIDDARARCEN